MPFFTLPRPTHEPQDSCWVPGESSGDDWACPDSTRSQLRHNLVKSCEIQSILRNQIQMVIESHTVNHIHSPNPEPFWGTGGVSPGSGMWVCLRTSPNRIQMWCGLVKSCGIDLYQTGNWNRQLISTIRYHVRYSFLGTHCFLTC